MAGKPKGDKALDVSFDIRFTDELLKDAKRCAKKIHRTTSDYIRVAVMEKNDRVKKSKHETNHD